MRRKIPRDIINVLRLLQSLAGGKVIRGEHLGITTVSHREVQSVEVSCFVHGPEDLGRVEEAVRRLLGVEVEPSSETLEGHFGNQIVHLVWHLTGEDAWTAFSRLMGGLDEEARSSIVSDLAANTDEHGALYLRIKKQSVISGSLLLSSSDPLRVRVKPRRFLMKGGPVQFYRTLIEEASNP